ncbi:MAG: ribonucleoside-diphosphate reductase subunit alpha [Opitutae bacterium]|nr:ribonucleoside-diphosphate reductase subunit alpha [Opitutae bacterium]
MKSTKRAFEEDQKLQEFARTPNDKKPHFDWGGLMTGDRWNETNILVAGTGVGETAFSIEEVADTIGSALTNLLLSREEQDIFSEKNQSFVAKISNLVGERLEKELSDGSSIILSKRDLHHLIEKALIENDAFDVAKSLLFARKIEDGFGRLDDNEENGSQLLLIRRNGKVVPWNESKIEIAIRKAFLSLELDSGPAVQLAREVSDRVQKQRQELANIEGVQDIVQEVLMGGGYYKVAEAYILYRARRAHDREATVQTGIAQEDENQESMVVVVKPNNDTYFWDGLDLRKRIEFGMIGLDLCLTSEEIEKELRRSVFAEMQEEDLKKTIILNAKALLEKDADFSKFAGRILLSYLYEEALDWNIVQDGVEALKDFHRRAFKRNIRRGVEIGRLDKRLLEYDLDKLGDALDPTSDLEFDYLGIQTLYDRYLIVDKTTANHVRLECPQLFWIRVSMGLFLLEEKDREDRIIELYSLYKSRRFCSSTPTLFNAGTLHSQLSSCYLYQVDDDLESIMIRGIAENAFLSKWAGGLGGSWTAVRGTGGYIRGTNGESQGIIPFLKLHNDQLHAVNQGGKRRGSGCAYLETWHNDLFDFLELRRNTGDERRRTHEMNTANWIPDLFMKRLQAQKDWTFFRSNEVPELHDLYGKAFEQKYCEYEQKAEAGEIFGEKHPAIEIWKKMLAMLFETGHPWITFKDPCNLRSPQDHVGVIHSSNLCTEITLNTGADETAVCNLGSVVLDSHLDKNGNLDHEKLRGTIRTAVRALDNVIDLNFYPTQAAKTSNLRHRPVGLGIMGLQNCLYRKDVPFASQEAVDFNDEFMEAIAFYAYEASSDLAKEHGTYSTYKGSKWDRGMMPQDSIALLEEERGEPIDVKRGGRMDWAGLRDKIGKQGMRNSNVLAIAPTATISNIMGSSPCIEPLFKNLFTKSNLSGSFIVLNQYLVRDLKKQNLWNSDMIDQLKYHDGELEDIAEIPEDLKKKYQTAFGVPYRYIVDAAAHRQKWIDQSQSVNLFLAEPNIVEMSKMYLSAWRKGLKTTYYLRTQSASNIEKATIDSKKKEAGPAEPSSEPKQCSILDPECEACQ